MPHNKQQVTRPMTTIQSLKYFGTLYLVSAWYASLGVVGLLVRYLKKGNALFRTEIHLMPKVLEGWNHAYVQLSEVRLHYVETGESSKPLMLCIHGFPEFWYSYRHQLRYFKDKYHVVAVDLRGYGASDKPNGVPNYGMDRLTKDMVEVIEQLSGDGKAIVVSHDWGAVIAWRLAIERPDVVEKLVVMNAPHPSAFQKALMSTWQQFSKSWYMFFFQCPVLPELFLRTEDMKALIQMFRGRRAGLVHAENFTNDDEAAWKYTFSRPHSFYGPVNFYRAALRRLGTERAVTTKTVEPPTLIIWGEKDAALEVRAAEDSLRYCLRGELKRIADASHWVQQDRPDLVNEFIEEFLERSPPEEGESDNGGAERETGDGKVRASL